MCSTNRFGIGRCYCRKMSHNLSPCNPPGARKRFVLLLMTLLVAAHQTVFSVACIKKSDPEILAVEIIAVRTQRHRLVADKFPSVSRLVGPGNGSIVIWIPASFSSGLSP